MDARELIQLQRLPFTQRMEKLYCLHQESVEKGSLVGRVGQAPVNTRMYYKDLNSENFQEKLIFGSNSYLGLSTDPYVIAKVTEAINKYGVGTGGSPALSGYTIQHQQLEKRLAELAEHEDAILLPTGFMANLCWVKGLMTRNDVLLYDKYSHASVIQAIKMTGVQFYPFDPDNMEKLEELILYAQKKMKPSGHIFSTVEGVRSIDGSVIDLERFVQICQKHNVFTILDDAHGVGTLGKNGKGTLEHFDLMGQVDVRMSTCSKAIGAQGAFLSGSRKTIHFLRNYSSPYTFTTALNQSSVAAISAALDILEREPNRVEQLRSNVRFMQEALKSLDLKIIDGHSGIVPFFIPGMDANEFNRRLHNKGLFANVVAYPMTPPGMDRIRLSIMSTHSQDEMDEAIVIIKETLKEFNPLNSTSDVLEMEY